MDGTSPAMTAKLFGASSVEHGGDLPAAPVDQNTPGAGLLARNLIEIARLFDAAAVDLHDHIAAAEADIAGQGAVIDVENDDALIDIAQLQFVGERRRQIGDLGARERRERAEGELG